jgi:hypothetical protein
MDIKVKVCLGSLVSKIPPEHQYSGAGELYLGATNPQLLWAFIYLRYMRPLSGLNALEQVQSSR